MIMHPDGQDDATGTRIARKGEWVLATVDHETAMMNVENGRIIGLNAVGTRIWELLDQPRERDWLVATLGAEFAVSPDQCGADVDVFLADLSRRGAILLQ